MKRHRIKISRNGYWGYLNHTNSLASAHSLSNLGSTASPMIITNYNIWLDLLEQLLEWLNTARDQYRLLFFLG